MNDIRFVEKQAEANRLKNTVAIHFYDVMVDGGLLLDQLEPQGTDMVSRFGFYNDKQLNIDTADEYLKIKPSGLTNGRILLFVCRECGDLGCGAITVEIEKKQDSYVWKNFAHENDSFELEASDYIDFPVLEFDKNQYENTLHAFQRVYNKK